MRDMPFVDMTEVEDLPDFCAKWPQIGPHAQDILKGPPGPQQDALIKWLVTLTDRVHFSDFR